MARIGFISGEISMAPIITAVEFVFKPTLAIKMAQNNITNGVPFSFTPFIRFLCIFLLLS